MVPSYAEDSESAGVMVDLIRPVLADQLESQHHEAPLSANHGRVIANFLKFFGDFQDWSEMFVYQAYPNKNAVLTNLG